MCKINKKTSFDVCILRFIRTFAKVEGDPPRPSLKGRGKDPPQPSLKGRGKPKDKGDPPQPSLKGREKPKDKGYQ